MKYIFVIIILWMLFKLFVLKKIKYKLAFVLFSLAAAAISVMTTFFEFSISDILGLV